MAKAKGRGARRQVSQAAQPRVSAQPAVGPDPATVARRRNAQLMIRGIRFGQLAVGLGMFANLALGGPLAVTIVCTVAFFALAALRMYLMTQARG